LRTLAILVTSAALAAAAAPVAMASQASPGNPSPTATGPPSQTCQNFEAPFNLLPSRGAANSPGAVFNEPNQISSSGTISSGGHGGNQYNLVGAPSQYDVACFQTQFKLTSP
jgi:hypothetical protein